MRSLRNLVLVLKSLFRINEYQALHCVKDKLFPFKASRKSSSQSLTSFTHNFDETSPVEIRDFFCYANVSALKSWHDVLAHGTSRHKNALPPFAWLSSTSDFGVTPNKQDHRLCRLEGSLIFGTRAEEPFPPYQLPNVAMKFSLSGARSSNWNCAHVVERVDCTSAYLNCLRERIN